LEFDTSERHVSIPRKFKIENPKEKQKINEKQIATGYIIRICKLHRQANKTTATWGSNLQCMNCMIVIAKRLDDSEKHICREYKAIANRHAQKID
jgi:hypothetical protein